MSTNETRKGLRIDVRIPVKVKLDNRGLEAEILNLSEGGAFVSCAADWKVGQTVKLEIQFSGMVELAGKTTSWEELQGKAAALSQGTPVSLPTDMAAKTVIRWTAEATVQDHPKGFGVEFTQLDPASKDALKKVIRYYESLRRAGVNFG